MRPELVSHPERAPGLVLGDPLELPADIVLGAHVIIHSGTMIGEGAVVQDHAILGKPQRLGLFSTASRDVSTSTVLGDRVAILAGSIVFSGAELAEDVTVGDQAHIRERTVIGAGTTVGRGSAIDNDVQVGERVRIQTNCYVTAHTVIEDDVFVAPGVVTANDNTMARHPSGQPLVGPTLRRACRVGAAAIICPGVEVGEEAFVAAGAVVAADVAPRSVVMGVPAREVRAVPDEDLLACWRAP